MDPFFRELIDPQPPVQRQVPMAQQPVRRTVYTFPVVDGDEGYDIGESYGYGRPQYYPSRATAGSPLIQRYGYAQPPTHVYQRKPVAPVYVAPVRLTNPLYFKLNHGPSESSEIEADGDGDGDGDIEIGNEEGVPSSYLEETIPEEPEVLQRNPLIGGEPPSKRQAHAFVRTQPQQSLPRDDSRYYGYVRPQKFEYVEPSKPDVQPMYIMDRYGNLYPYNRGSSSSSSGVEKKDIGANELINLLLGGVNDDGNGEAKGDKDEREDEPLTKKGLANLLTKIAEQEKAEEEENEMEQDKEKEIEEEKAKVRSIPEPVAGSTTTKFVPPPSAPPTSVRRQSTVPELKVHSGTPTDSTTPKTIENDVKVSAPQLKSKNLPFSPPVNIYEFKSKYIVVVSIPGVNKEFVEIDYHPSSNELIIKGEAKNQYLSEDDEVANSFVLKLSEQRFGKFERVVKLPAYPGIEDSEIKAKFKDGMLEIKLPKVDESKVKKAPKKIQLEEVADEELERESSSGLI